MVTPPHQVAFLLNDPAWPRLCSWVREKTGLDFHADKVGSLAERIARRLDAHPGTCLGEYLNLLIGLEKENSEEDALIAEIVVPETFFFRYPEQFEAISSMIVPEWVARHGARRLFRAWSAGCSNGAEAYTLAVVLQRHTPLLGWQVEVLGTDINRYALAEAKQGEYTDWAIKSLSPSDRDVYLDRRPGRWHVKEPFRHGVSFAVQNLVSDPPPYGPFDLILCRNVLMYFDVPTRRAVLRSLYQGLDEGGWLLVGHAEAGPDVAEIFQPVAASGTTIYRRSSRDVPVPIPLFPQAVPVPMPFRPADLHAVKVRSSPAARSTQPDPGTNVVQLLDRGEWTAAAAASKTWTDAEPLNPAAHFHLGQALEPLSEPKAIAAFRRAVYLDPCFALAHFHLVLLNRRRGRDDLADRHRRAALTVLSKMADDAVLPCGQGLAARNLAGALDVQGSRTM